MDKAKFDYARELKSTVETEENKIKEKGPLSIADKVKLTRLFEGLGKAFLAIGDERTSKIGISYYKKAEDYTPYPNVKERIEKNIESFRQEHGDSDLRKILKDSRTFAIISMATLTIALLFVSSSLTGFSILNVSSDNSRWISSCFFICGLIFTFVYLKTKKR